MRLLILHDKYQCKANDYMRAYQIDGQFFQPRTAERNEFMAQTVADLQEQVSERKYLR